ncbi:hypothetical protein [uncultured Alloprevotella sp.]|uniref:hypothetical protein n=1 Tax=uncultured Alloprevotella sp. TaxID=1283315 RepID=UPI00262B23A2|nr:hypothetical protein [uncultured Alloprevotella sp.]
MKKTLYTLLLTLPLLFIGCGETGNYGYPSKVVLTKSGGDKEVKGTDSPYLIEIRDYDGNGAVSNPLGTAGDSMIVSYQWLTIKAKKGDTKLQLIAAPNQSGKSRTLYVHAPVMDTGAEIKVVQ